MLILSVLNVAVGSRRVQHLQQQRQQQRQRQRWELKPFCCYQLSSFDSKIKAIEKRGSVTYMDYISVSSI